MTKDDTDCDKGSQHPEATTTTTRKEKNSTNGTPLQKQVRFDESSNDAKQTSIASRVKQMNAQVKAQRRFKIGTGKTNVIRQVISFVFIVVAVFWYALSSEFQNSKTDKKSGNQKNDNNKNRKIPGSDTINKAAEMLTRTFMEKTEKIRRKEPCGLYIHTSTIPRANKGLFAGRDYEVGEIIFETPWFVPMNQQDGEYYSSLALVMKFHPTLANIDGTALYNKGDDDDVDDDHDDHDDDGKNLVFRATRTIEAGQELFLPYEKHPVHFLRLSNNPAADLYRNIPTIEEYDLADEITKLVVSIGRQMEVAHSRKVQDAIRQMELSYLYHLGRQITSKFNPVVSDLIPSTRGEYNKRGSGKIPAHLSGLQNQTLTDLEVLGSCLTDINTTTTSISENNNTTTTKTTTTIVSARNFEKGETVHVVPLHFFFTSSCNSLVESENEKQCTLLDHQTQNRCISTVDSNVIICPLSSFIPQWVGRVGDNTTNDEKPNVEIVWKTRKVDELSLDNLRTRLPGDLAWKVVALRSIAIGDKIIIDSSKDLSSYLVPTAWRSVIE